MIEKKRTMPKSAIEKIRQSRIGKKQSPKARKAIAEGMRRSWEARRKASALISSSPQESVDAPAQDHISASV